jgi:uncharacterized protein
MKKILLFLLLNLSFSSLFAQNGRRIEVLFLGDNGHHKPIERVPFLMAALGNKGINITYTDKLEDINSKNLNKYDALLIYANWDAITPEAEKALLDYVASGKGILPIHCASYCFRNSPEYIKLVGGQFWRHTMDSISTQAIQPKHPIMDGVKPFTVFDETYLHSQLQADNNVLATRIIKADQTKDKPNEKTEPYTWTRNYGKGRVFYTAFGHDENTWANEDFLKMIENGILWSINDEAKASHSALNSKPMEYKGAKLPNYEKRPGEQLQQLALTPEESKKHIQVPVDFTLDLFAAEPNVMHPIAMAWDEKGRLYVLITKDYPNERKASGGSDYILICEDTDKDGKADKFTQFASGLSIPTGMVFANGGLIVSQAPDMIFLKDTDGDDKADEKKILFTGFGTGDTHAGPSSLHYGFDNWIWGCIGYSGFNGKVGADSLKFGQAFFKFKPDGSKMECTTSTSNNTWGFSFNETGDVFGSTANNAHGWYMAIPHKNFLNPGFNQDNGSRNMDTHKDIKPITSKVRQVDVFGGFTAAAGHNFYNARAFPKQYWNKIAFVCEPTGHVVHQNNIVKNGTNYEDKEAFNLLAGADEWVSPVFAQVGPDGAVWIADWYSYIIQHNPKPNGFTMGVGNAYETDLRDYTHGRIYRVGYKQAPQYQPISLSKSNPEGLLSALSNSNYFWRNHAQRLLVERANIDVVPQLLAILTNSKLDEAGINPAAIHALRTLEGLGVLKEEKVLVAIYKALKNDCAGVRKNAVQILPRNAISVEVLLKNDVLNDAEPLVVMNAILALSEMPLSDASEKAILDKLMMTKDTEDLFMTDAFACALNSNGQVLLKKAIKLTAQNAKPKMSTEMPMNHDHSKNISDKIESKIEDESKPDLMITNIVFDPASPTVRGYVGMKIEVKNLGKAIPKGVIISIVLKIESGDKKTEIISQNFEAGVATGETIQITKNTNGPWSGGIGYSTDISGEYTVTADVDKFNEVLEGNEKNNRFQTKITFKKPENMLNYAIGRATKSLTSISDFEAVFGLIQESKKLDNEGATMLIKGIADGWPAKKKITPTVEQTSILDNLEKGISSESKVYLNRWKSNFLIPVATKKDPNLQVIVLKTLPEAMKYDQKQFVVKAGLPVEINFENHDAMQHNLVIGKPKSLEIIGKAANKMITEKDAAERNYVPSIPQILFSTPIINPNQTFSLKFIAPTTPGNYPFVCTFPGHWSIMNGVMKVVK